MEHLYTFTMTFQEATMVVAGLRKLPMEHVEALVKNLDDQFKAQATAMPVPPTPASDDMGNVAPAVLPVTPKVTRRNTRKTAVRL